MVAESGKSNGKCDDHFIWTCPGCNVSYIDSTYCYGCDIQHDEDDPLPSDTEK